NFFHEGKCRKKPPQPPEAQPIPTSRTTTIDNMDNDERESPGDDAPAVPAVICSSPTDSQTFSRPLPTAPEDLEAVLQAETPQQTLMKCESPPPYCESADRNEWELWLCRFSSLYYEAKYKTGRVVKVDENVCRRFKPAGVVSPKLSGILPQKVLFLLPPRG
ncbi:hypothetical protein AVEN_232190-1, partial [Araneus ventricosus]